VRAERGSLTISQSDVEMFAISIDGSDQRDNFKMAGPFHPPAGVRETQAGFGQAAHAADDSDRTQLFLRYYCANTL
jgi:hypothetical protein